MYMASNKKQGEKTKRRFSEQKPALKHLGFVRVVVINVFIWLSDLYQRYTKQQRYSGAFKSTVVYVITTITRILTPLYLKFKDVPDALLLFLDTKVDEALHEYDKLAPPLVKQFSGLANSVVIKLSDAATQLGKAVKADGPTELYKLLRLFLLAKLWYGIIKIYSLNIAAQMVLRTVSHISKKYNEVISGMAGKGYSVFCYLPLVPIDDIAWAYKQVEAAYQGKSAAFDESPGTKIVGKEAEA